MPQTTFAAPVIAVPHFDAVLTPNDSSTPSLRRALGAFAALYVGVFVLLWVSIGAWPVLGHSLLVGSLLVWSMRADRRRAAIWERVVVRTDKTIVVKGVGPSVHQRIEWPTAWLRVDFSTNAPQIALNCSGRRTTLGASLSPEDRHTFAAALAAALAQARMAI